MQKLFQKISRTLKSEPDIAFAYLFGSVAKGRNGPLSDVDVAVYFSPEGDARSRFRRQIQLTSKLNNVLERDDVDVLRLQDAPLDLAREIVEHGKLLFCHDDNLRVDFVFRVVRDYLDAEPLRKLEWEALEAYFEDENYGRPPRHNPRPPEKAARNAGRILKSWGKQIENN
jgi:predicted nucleotidyltransferase